MFNLSIHSQGQDYSYVDRDWSWEPIICGSIKDRKDQSGFQVSSAGARNTIALLSKISTLWFKNVSQWPMC
jgi:hypothetical protein